MLRLSSSKINVAARQLSAAGGFGKYARGMSTSFSSTDGGFEKDRLAKGPGSGNQRDFTYFMLGGARFVYASAARLALIKFVSSMSATADVLALASAEFDTDAIAEGTTLTVKWRGKPVFIRHRTEAEIAAEAAVDVSSLRDPQTDSDRYQEANWLIVLGICTHLGCVPISGAGEYGGWFCPCHGSHYDTSGRIRKGPAPLNMEIPEYTLDGTKLVVG
jgi:ubiquinol-cytochrome c reductase iron-sulfur subunit